MFTAKQQSLVDLAIRLSLIVACFLVYAQASEFDFVDYDDGQYTFQNAHVLGGLSPSSIWWALTAVVSNNWMPVTLLSHLVDAQLFGMDAGLQHLVNVFIHALAALLLYLTLYRATGARATSAFVAFLFAVHPLHVGSVAWIAERKDVLGAFFWFLALYEYVRYSETPNWRRYLLVVVPFCLGLMSKPMLVTLPFTLLLFDIWPLRRTRFPRTLWEKLPFFALSAAASVVTYRVQGATGALFPIALTSRIAHSFLSYVVYLGQTLWPTRLAFFYPYPHSTMLWQVLVAASLLAGLSVFAIVSRRTIPYVTVGWFWFLGTLVPVIGIVQVGMQDHADRYMYVPMVGLLLIAAWGGADLVKAWPAAQPAIAALAVVCCAASMFASRKEVAYWRNSESLFGRALEVTQDNWVAHFALGNYLARTGHVAAALPHFEEAVRIVPDYPDGHNDLGAALMQLGDCEAAGVQFRLALQKEPNRADANYNLGQCQAATGNDAAAIRYYEAAIKARPGYLDAMVGLGRSLSRFPSHAADAIACYDVALRLAPDDPRVHADLGKLLAKLGRKEEAIEHLEAAERLRPDPEVRKILDGLR